MKSSQLLFTALATFISTSAFAASGQIKSLNCVGTSSNGTTTITYSGVYMGKNYVNISNVPTFGLPFSQQAEIKDADYTDGLFKLNLHTVLTNTDMILTLQPESDRGILSLSGANSGQPMKCSSTIIAAE